MVPGPASGSGCDEKHRDADDRRGDQFSNPEPGALPCHLCYVVETGATIGGQVESGPLISTRQRRAVTFKGLLCFSIVALVAAALFAGGFATWNWWSSRSPSGAQIQGEPIATRTVGDLTIGLYGDLHNGQSEVLVRFTDSSGQPTDVGDLKTN